MPRIKRYILGLMKDEKYGLAHAVPKFLLYITSLFYLCAIRIWNYCYDKGIFKIHCVNAKVISVGNITLGGTGKTPFTAYLAEILIRQDKKIAILIRGYGDDEWRILEKKFPSVPVIKGRDRIKSAEEAINKHSAEILILDDGFQHRRIARDLDILLLDSHEAFGKEYIFPRGILREPIDSIKRADIVILTKTDFGKDNIRNLRIVISGDFKKHNALEAVYKPVCFFEIGSANRFEPEIVKGKKVFVFSAIANSDYFKYMLKDLGANVSGVSDYPDHHDYTQKDLENVCKKAKESRCDFVITTEKDAVKLNAVRRTLYAVRILALHIELEIIKGAEDLIDRLNSI